MEPHVDIVHGWTNEPLVDLKKDFMDLANAVFGMFVTDDYYKSKFMDNIYGPSLVTVAYVDGHPAGADVMWRNDLAGEKAYQTVDTCVLERYRGMGLFRKITNYELGLLGSETFVYGFPNVNSYPGYVKMGWQVQRLFKTLCRPSQGEPLPSDYAAWWLKTQPGIRHLHKNGNYYLIRKNDKTPVATLIGQVDAQTAQLFPEMRGTWLLKHFQTKPSIYNKNKSIPLVCNGPNKEIPYWKIDAI